MVAPMLMQIQTWLMQTKVWRYVGFASAVVGLLCYALSSSFNYLFGEWNLLKIFLFVVFSFITCVVILFAEIWQHSRSHRFKAHIAVLVLTITSVYSFFFDKQVNGKPADAYSLISCAAFAVMSLSLSKQTQCGFEVDLLYFFLGCLIIQLMRTELPLGIVGVGFSYFLIILRSSFSSMDAAAPDYEYPGLPDDNSVVLDVDSLQIQLASTDIASSMMEQLSSLPEAAVNYFQDAMPGPVSRWARAGTRAAKVGKGLSKDEKAQKLAMQYWVETIDPCHRYGYNLHMYYDTWFKSQSTQPFFYWLEFGDGKEISLEKCPRSTLQRQCIKYLGPNEREEYEVTIEKGRLVYRKDGRLVDTDGKSKWIFVLSTTRTLYVGRKQKGTFEHSSFLAGGATTAAGRLLAHQGVLEAIWPYSGHYRPTEDNFKEFISFLEEHNVDLTNVKVRFGDVPETMTLLQLFRDVYTRATRAFARVAPCWLL